ncbi:unnamed protein product [Dibothriocephalus latus]|uniref:Beta-lactamase-related domain-containing protein n=1 Tax=Dibothriocephalus latus TaxID=60516 RepID=A0A3P7NT67_DIBLA|nr:unnamed protein product [Dibothriocephalus latus]
MSGVNHTGFAYPSDQLSLLSFRDEPEIVVKSLFKKHPVFPSGMSRFSSFTILGTHSFHFHTLDVIASDIVVNIDIKKRPLARFFLDEVVWPRGPIFYPQLRLNCHPDFVEVPLSSINLFTNARTLAKLLTYLLPTTGPNPLFSESTLQWMLSPGSAVHNDPILQRSVQYTKSGLFIETSPEGKPIIGLRDDILGQVAFVDQARNLTFAYVTNHAHGCSVKRDWILKTLIHEIYACLLPQ